MQKSSSTPSSSNGSSKAEQVVSKAMSYVNRGNPYAYGGSGEALTSANISKLASRFKNNDDAYYDHLRSGGKDYSKVGQSGMECVDCSGLTQKVFGSVGISIPRTASEQYSYGQNIGLQNAQPGDLIVRQGHAAIMGTGGKIIEAKGWKWGCTHDRKPDDRYKAIRLVSGGSDVTSGSTTGGATTASPSTTTGGSASFNVTSAVNYNKKRGYSKSEWKMIQSVIGTEADGIPGKNTATAIYSWQLSHGLEADGKCGPATYRAIQNASAGAVTTPSTPAPAPVEPPSTSTTESSSEHASATPAPAPVAPAPTTGGSANFNVTSAVNYNKKRGYSKSEWKKIQQVVGTEADGIPGKNTATAIYHWQLSHGLEADGKCGPATYGAIQSASAGATTTPSAPAAPSVTTAPSASTTEGGSGSSDSAEQTQVPDVPQTSEAGVGAKRSGLASNWVDFGTTRSSKRTEKISKITIHHTAGTGDATGYAKYHRDGDREASANYYVGKSGDICGGVEENRRAWTSSNKANDQKAITIEVSNSKKGDPWPISDASYRSLISLCQDLCSRHNISPHFDGTPSASLTAHYMFASTACPGPTIKGMLKSGKIENDIKNGVTSGPVTESETQQQGSQAQNQSSQTNSSSVNINVSAAVAYNKGKGYSKETWKQIQAKVGTDVDGDPGQKTAKAIAVWQREHGLEVDGKCGPATLAAMNITDNTTAGSSGETDMSQYQGGTGAGYPTIATWNQQTIFNYFVNEVYADHPARKAIAAGFLGNIYTESHYQQDAEQCPGKKNSGGKGIIQWDNRKKDLYNYCGSNYTDKKWVDLAKQLSFTKFELNGTEKSADKSIRNSVSADSASAARKAAHTIAKKFERPANPDNIERQDKAEENYNKFA